MKISLKKANFSDIEFLWYLRNQPNIYKYFRNPKKAEWSEHINWILPILLGVSPKYVFIITQSNIPIGQIRVDYENPEKSDISISILEKFRGKGIAVKALLLAIKEIKKSGKVKKLLAEIHETNFPSIKLFGKLNFKMEKRKGKWLRYILKL